MGEGISHLTRMKAHDYIADFDSSTSILKATSAYIRGESFRNMRMFSKPAGAVVGGLMKGLNRRSEKTRERLYAASGATETVRVSKLADFNIEDLAGWVTGQYPDRRYQAVLIGSSNGAASHLAAALQAPWLPQSFLLPVRRLNHDTDNPMEDYEFGKEHAGGLLSANPDIELHHMLDPVNDRLMGRHLSYFRIKRRSLGPSYKEFLTTHLEPGGTIFILDCTMRWPTTAASDRHFYQLGGLGGVSPDEYYNGSDRTRDFLRKYEAGVTHWNPPEPDGERPEAEWGYEPRLTEEIVNLAAAHGFRLRKITYHDPEELSPLVADLYRWWYRERNIISSRLLVETFSLIEPYLTLRTGSVPFWLSFPTDPAADHLERYLDKEAFDEIGMILLSHGIESIGLLSQERANNILARARQKGVFVGTKEHEYPRDFTVLLNHHEAILNTFSATYPMPGALTLSAFDAFLKEAGRKRARMVQDIA